MSRRGRVLVTGATGFVGSALVRAFLAAGYPVRALVRATSPRDNVAGLEIESVEGDICDPAAVARAMTGVAYLAHAAADYRLWARDLDAIVHTNVEGTRTVMRAALSAGVERVVYTSSVATLALGADGRPADENVPLSETAAVGAYKRSKVTAERLVETMTARDALPAVIVNPSTPVGPRDIARLEGRRPPRVKLPRAPLYPLAVAAQMLATVTGREPLLTLDGLRMSRQRMFFSTAKAERDLGFHARPYAEGLRDAVDWFRGAGYL